MITDSRGGYRPKYLGGLAPPSLFPSSFSLPLEVGPLKCS